MLDAFLPVIIGMAAGFEDVIKSNKIALYVHIRIGNGIPHARLRRQIDDHRRLVLIKDPFDQCLVRNVSPY